MLEPRPHLAPCGIDCAECGSYKTTVEHDIQAAEELVPWYRGMGWIGENEGAEAVMRKNPLCRGCRNHTEDCFFKCSCHFFPCCENRKIAHCGECGEFPCKRYSEFAAKNAFYKKAMENLLSLRANTR